MTSPRGRGTVDLTKMALTAPLPSDVVVPLDVTASNVTVVIPDDVPVKIEADMTMGNLNEGGTTAAATPRAKRATTRTSPEPSLVVEIDGTFSNITIQEGN